MSFQNTGWQREFVARNQLPFALLSDEKAELALNLYLETFKAGQRAFLKRRTFVVNNGQIIHDRQKIAKPEADAAQVLDWLKSQ